MLELKNISKSYGDQLILNDISFQVQEKELVSILGPSGSGKSTLLQIIGLLNTADSGRILLDDVECTTLNEKEEATQLLLEDMVSLIKWILGLLVFLIIAKIISKFQGNPSN
jgi:ABC-type sugar transport system ATPase subunit